MATPQERENSIQDTITDIYNGLVNVSVITAIGDVTVSVATDADSGKIVPTVADGAELKAFVTQIDLVDGDVISTLPSDYADHESVHALHAQQVEASVAVLPNNIRTLARVAGEIIKIVNPS